MTESTEELDALAIRLSSIAEEVAQSNPTFAAAVEAFILRLASVYTGASAPQRGDPFPAFVLPSTDGRLVLAEEFRGAPTVVSFMRGHWCPYCKAQADAFATAAARLAAAGANLVIITPERAPFASQLMPLLPKVTILCDLDNGFAAGLGLLAVMDAHFSDLLRTHGYDLPLYQGSETWSVPAPATFVLDRAGVVVASAIDPDYRRRMRMSALFAAVEEAARL